MVEAAGGGGDSSDAERGPTPSPLAGGGLEAAGFVLAGGQSRRMGRDKALVRLAGRPLIEHSLAILQESGLPVKIAGAGPGLEEFAPVVEDAAPGLGPLSGICAALASTSAQLDVFLSIDLPLVPVSLIEYMLCRARLSNAAVTVPSVNGFPQTFPAVVAREALPLLLVELNAGRAGCYAAFRSAAENLDHPMAELPSEVLAQSGHAGHPMGLPPALWFFNVNTPADLERAGRVLASRNRVI